jgi:S1-C subfamily serine protease
MAVKFFVKAKYPKGSVTALPTTIDGLPTDVEQAGTFRAFKKTSRPKASAAMPNPRKRMRPALPGCSIGFRIAGDEFVMGGTFGALVKTSSKVYILSNNHVLADENRLPIGSPIFQPALLDRGKIDSDQIAELTRFVKLKENRFNKIDAALAAPLNKNLVGKEVLHIGAPSGTAEAEIDMMVHKFGRTTSYTVGRIVSVDTDVTVEYETANFAFENQIIIYSSNNKMFSDSGDSGSLILQRGSNAAVGLLFGGGPDHTIANHIANVLRSLRVRI